MKHVKLPASELGFAAGSRGFAGGKALLDEEALGLGRPCPASEKEERTEEEDLKEDSSTSGMALILSMLDLELSERLEEGYKLGEGGSLLEVMLLSFGLGGLPESDLAKLLGLVTFDPPDSGCCPGHFVGAPSMAKSTTGVIDQN